MQKIVVKFGGSNLKKKEDVQKLVDIVKAYDQPLVIVVSAFFGITNKLTQILQEVKGSQDRISEFTSFLRKLKEEAIKENFDDEVWANQTMVLINKRIEELERYLQGVFYIGDVPGFVEDIVLSYGERLSSLILSAILQSKGINAEEALPEELGLITDGEFGNATVQYDACTCNVQERLLADKVFIVPGFYGISTEGKVTLLGRGGTDYSAASIARCIKATSLDVWKDVDGFMTADPKLVEHPKRIDHLSYTEAAELSYFGAGILHPRTVEPVKILDIPIRVLNIDTFTNAIIPKTIIHSSETIDDCIVKSVTYSNDFSILMLKGAGVGMKKGVLAKTTSALDRANINIKSVITSQIAINFLVSNDDIKSAFRLIEALNLPTVTELHVMEDVTTVAAVGEGIIEKSGVAGRMFMAMAQEDINIRMIASGASPVATYFVVANDDRKRAIKALHNEFFKA